MLFRGEFSTFGYCPKIHRHITFTVWMQQKCINCLLAFQPEISILGKIRERIYSFHFCRICNLQKFLPNHSWEIIKEWFIIHFWRDFHRFFFKIYDLQKIFSHIGHIETFTFLLLVKFLKVSKTKEIFVLHFEWIK